MFPRLLELRKQAKLKQKQVAEILDCSQQLYSDYEHGRRGVSIEAFIKLADYYHVSIDYIVGRTDVRETATICNIGSK